MRKRFFMMLALLGVLIAPSLAIAEMKPSASAELGVQTLYYSRGEAKSRDSIIFMPAMAVSYGDISVNIAAVADSSPYVSNVGGANSSKLKEPTLSIAYAKQINIVKMGLAVAYCGKDGDKDEKEVSLSLGLDTRLAPTLTVYQTVGIRPETYLTLGVFQQIPINNWAKLNLKATAGYLMSQTTQQEAYSASYFRTNDDGSLSNDKYNGFLDGVVSAGVAFDLGKGLSVEPFLACAFALSNDARNFFKATSKLSFDKSESSYLFGGAKLSFSF